MKTWRLIKLEPRPGPMQMAIDEAMLLARIENSVPNTLRFFTWRPACVTIGYFQSLSEEVDLAKARAMGVDVVRRYTGGGAVFHENELTYSLVIPEQEVAADIVESYGLICGAIVEALRLLGVEAQFKPINDIVAGGKKISGNAQTRKEGMILQHGTILSKLNLEKMFSVLKVPDEKIKDKMIKAAAERVTSLADLLGQSVGLDRIEKALIRGFEQTFKVRVEKGELSPAELKTAEKLYKEKYSSNAWNDRR